MKSVLLITGLILSLSVGHANAQTFTKIDSLPDGAYGNAAWGDFDNDGFKDLAYLSQSGPDAICKIYHNVGNVFTEVTQHFPLLYNPGVKWGDLNNDGFDDLVVNGMDSAFINRTFIYQSLGNGSFISMPNTIKGLSAGNIDIADYNNDGFKDIAVTGNDSVGVNRAFIYKNLGSFNFVNINAPLIGVHFGELKWGDYNHDTLPDLVINGIGNIDFRTRVYKNMGNDSFVQQPFYMKGSGGTVDWVDLDNDGWLDILVTGYDSTSSNTFTEVHHNNMNGTFSLVSTNLPDFGEPSGVAVADYNNDGKMDVCFIGGTSVFPSDGSALAINTALNTYNVQQFFRGNIINPIIATADIDNDGDYDLIFSNLILRNDQVTGVNNMTHKETGLVVYPSPANDVVNIQFTSDKKEKYSVTVVDVTGQMIFAKTNYATEGINIEALRMQNVSSGIYFLILTEEERTIRAQVVKE